MEENRELKNRLPLSGTKILDFSWALAGPYSTYFLSCYGACVIKIESIYTPDILRRSTPYKNNMVGINRSFVYAKINSNKYSISLNLNHPRATAIIKLLMKWADVVVNSFVGDRLEKMNLGYEELKKIKPEIIMVNTTSQGRTGPFAKHPAYGYQTIALSGFTELTGWSDREAVVPVGAYTDFVTPSFLVLAILAALIHRDKTGNGQFIDLSQLEASLHMLAPSLLNYSYNGRIQKRDGNRSERACPHNAYRCLGEERWCVISIFTEEQWDAFCRVLEKETWTTHPKFKTHSRRKEHEAELDDLIGRWTLNFDVEEIMVRLQSAGVPCGIVKHAGDIFRDPQLKYRGHFQFLNHPEIGDYTCGLPPFRLLNNSFAVKRPAPCMGEHNEYVYKNILGMNDEEIATLISEGAFD